MRNRQAGNEVHVVGCSGRRKCINDSPVCLLSFLHQLSTGFDHFALLERTDLRTICSYLKLEHLRPVLITLGLFSGSLSYCI